ncbi:MAG: SprT-like domain-containing protein [Myxococcota bacterium]
MPTSVNPTTASDSVDDHLSAELERSLIRELHAEWGRQNTRQFEGAMRPPTLGLHEVGALGQFHSGRRTLTLQRAFVLAAPWGQVVEVLRHEMAHQYVRETLGIHDESPHGASFRRVCRDRGIDARAAGLPVAEDPVEQRLVRRIQALLRLADSPEPHEAAAAARAARRLLAEHDLSLTDPDEARTFRQVGPCKGRFDPWEKTLAGLLGEHFGVSVIYVQAYRPTRGTWGRIVELMGPAHHVEIAAYVHDVLRDTGETLWAQHRRSQGLNGNAERRRYLFGVLVGFRETLQRELNTAETALVKVKDSQTAAYVRRRYPHLRTGRRASVKTSRATEHGRAAGRNIQLRPGVSTSGGPPRQITRQPKKPR